MLSRVGALIVEEQELERLSRTLSSRKLSSGIYCKMIMSWQTESEEFFYRVKRVDHRVKSRCSLPKVCLDLRACYTGSSTISLLAACFSSHLAASFEE
jgi:hypothetical protein